MDEPFLRGGQGDGLDEDGVLGPGLEAGQQDAGVLVLFLGQIHVHHIPAVGAAAVLPLVLLDVPDRPVQQGRGAVRRGLAKQATHDSGTYIGNATVGSQ